MAYVRNEWKENDIITAEKLNNIEEGIYQSSSFITEVDLTDCFNQLLESDNYSYTKQITEEEANRISNSLFLKVKVADETDNYMEYYLGKVAYMNSNNSTTSAFSVIPAPLSLYFFCLNIYSTENSQYNMNLILFTPNITVPETSN